MFRMSSKSDIILYIHHNTIIYSYPGSFALRCPSAVTEAEHLCRSQVCGSSEPSSLLCCSDVLGSYMGSDMEDDRLGSCGSVWPMTVVLNV